MVPTTAFGETFQYSNLLVMAGGYAAGHAWFPKLAVGPGFDRAMQEQVFRPLGMKDTTYDFARAAKGDHATPHARALDGAIAALPLSDETWATTVRPAGGQWSSVHDYTRVLLLELGKGELDGKRVVSEDALMARRKPQVKISEHASYGMGLVVGDYTGVPIVRHNGGTAGFTTNYFWLPEHGIGVVFVCNVGADGVPDLVQRRVLEVVFDGEAHAERDLAEAVAKRKKDSADELGLLSPLDGEWFAPLAGAWAAPGLGRIVLARDGDHLVLDAGEWKARAGEKRGKDGTRAIETTSPPFAGLELVPEDRDGKRVLVLHDQQHDYVFEKLAK
jgi:CubicO group peptidase (beta-lactamase class C family)